MTDRGTTEGPWRRRLIHPLEALVAYAAFGVLRLLPFKAASALGGLAGQLKADGFASIAEAVGADHR